MSKFDPKVVFTTRNHSLLPPECDKDAHGTYWDYSALPKHLKIGDFAVFCVCSEALKNPDPSVPYYGYVAKVTGILTEGPFDGEPLKDCDRPSVCRIYFSTPTRFFNTVDELRYFLRGVDAQTWNAHGFAYWRRNPKVPKQLVFAVPVVQPIWGYASLTVKME